MVENRFLEFNTLTFKNFQVPVTTKDGKPKVDPRKVKAHGPGLEPEKILPGMPTSFIVDASETGVAPLEVTIGDENRDLQGVEDDDSDMSDLANQDSLRKGSSNNESPDDSTDLGSNNDESYRKGSRDSKKSLKPFDEDEDGFGIGDGKKEGKGLVALRARADSLSRSMSKDGLLGEGSNSDEDKNNNGGLGSRKGSKELLNPKGSRRNTFSQPVVTDKGNGIHEVSYVPPPIGDPYEVSNFLIILNLHIILLYRVRHMF